MMRQLYALYPFHVYREVGTIIRSLNCYPSEAELGDMIQEVEEEEPTGFIRLEKFQPMMARVLMERRYTAVCVCVYSEYNYES